MGQKELSSPSKVVKIIGLLAEITSRWVKEGVSPYKLIFSITDKCNQRCRTCNIWRKEPRNELSVEEFSRIFKRYGKIRWLSLTGGEPFLRQDISEIASRAVESNPIAILNIPTNGYEPEKIYERVRKIVNLDIPLVYITISLDGSPEVHNELRGVEGAWSNALKTYRMLNKIDSDSLRVSFEHLLSPFNLGEFKRCFDEASKEIPSIEREDFHITIFHASDYYYENMESVDELKLGKMLGELEHIKAKNSGFDLLYPSKLMNRLFLKNSMEKFQEKTGRGCNAVKSFLFVSSDGTVFPCPIFNEELGNLRNENYSLSRIVETSEKAITEISQGKCPGCWMPCTAHSRTLGDPRLILKGIF